MMIEECNSNDDRRMKSIDSTEAYAYGISKNFASEKEILKRTNIITRYKND